MRCLRCALDYGPEVQYCDRCGRTLSRPPGQSADDDAGFNMAQDLSSLYSTFVPPRGERAAATAARPREYVAAQGESSIATLDEQRLATDTRAWAAAPVHAPSDTAPSEEQSATWTPSLRDETADPIPLGSNAPLQGAGDDARRWEAEEQEHPQPRRNALPGAVRIDPPLATGTEDVAEENDLFDAHADPFAGMRGKPLTIGSDLEDPQRRGGRAFGLPRARVRREAGSRLPLAGRLGILLVMLAVVLGALAHARQATYSNDLHTARRLASTQRYAAALARYQQAIGEWPLNDAATREQAHVAATATAVVAQATAVAQQLQARVSANVQRASVYAAWQRMRRQNAQQAPGQ